MGDGHLALGFVCVALAAAANLLGGAVVAFRRWDDRLLRYAVALGADLVIASDVWELGALLRGLGLHPLGARSAHLYPSHYRRAVHHTDVLVTPSIPPAGYVPGARAVERMIAAGERAAWRELERLGVGAAA